MSEENLTSTQKDTLSPKQSKHSSRFTVKKSKRLKLSGKPKKRRLPDQLGEYWRNKQSEETTGPSIPNETIKQFETDEEVQISGQIDQIKNSVDHNKSYLVECVAPPKERDDEWHSEEKTDSADNEDLFVHTSCSQQIENVHKITGRRIVDITHFIVKMQELNDHGPIGCNLSNMFVVREKRRGYKSVLIFKCLMCNIECQVETEPRNEQVMDINTAAVAGSISAGAGYAQLAEITSAMNIPTLAANTYSNYQDSVFDGFEKSALAEMAKSAEEEAKIAIQHGEVDRNGTPILTVVADGSWPKRSFGKNYSSLSGVAAIVGLYTGKVIFLGWRNKYCTLCNRAKNAGIPVKTHTCYRNFSASSTSMEADVIVDGFLNSEAMYGVKYGVLVADGDSSVYSKILQARPYDDLTVEKVECTNHLLRNYGNKLRDVVRNGKLGNIMLRQKIAANIVRLRNAVTKAAEYRSKQGDLNNQEKLNELKKDLLNSPSHIFGEHLNCKDRGYFCNGPKQEDVNLVPRLTEEGLYIVLQKLVSGLAVHCRSLLRHLNSNIVEQFFSIVAKFIGGKRINYTQRRSYQGRCTAAVVSHNTHTPMYVLHKTLFDKQSPGKFTKLYEVRRLKVLQNRKNSTTRRRRKLFPTTEIPDKDYGSHAEKPDLPHDIFEEKKKQFLDSLKRSVKEIQEFERATVLQRKCGMWMEERRKLLTASVFGTVCCRRPYTSCQTLVKALLYTDFDSMSLKYGRDHESDALQAMEKVIGSKIKECGLFIDHTHQYLGATPDGLVGDSAIVEVKCPASAKELTPEQAILSRKVTFWNLSKDKKVIVDVNKKHKHYFQIQGQLHITKKDICYYGVWTPLGIKVEAICRDDQFWNNEMEEKLKKFYMDCVVPELVDSRQRRSMPIRDPIYVLQSQEQNQRKRKLSLENTFRNKKPKERLL